MLTQLFTNQASDASSSSIDHGGGEVEVIVAGDLGGGTVTLEAWYDDVAEWVAVRGGTWTDPEVGLLKTVRPCLLRLTLSGSAAPVLNAWI